VDTSSKYPFARDTPSHVAMKLLRVGGGGKNVSISDGNSFVVGRANEVCDPAWV